MIKLFGFGKAFGVMDASPFVLKLHTYFRMIGVDYEDSNDSSNLQSAPKGKLPFIDDNGKKIADSSFIIDYINNKYKPTIDDFLTDQEKAIAYLIGKSLDENLYWCLVYARWVREDTWQIIKKNFFDKMPFPLRHIVPIIARRDIKNKIKKHGIGLHSDQEILDIADKSFKALSDFLGNKKYFMGDKICSLDANAFGILAEFILVSLDDDFNTMAKKYKNLVDYCNRINKEFY
ncbi:MAG: glutathione S-transferase [Candidatus Cloacimonadota bacterium]|nr:MAG: glutathione S-transferase [Candidatus Cloacimonadota bacterium]PCJ21011.1 MAG: glutathione S-transferase [Candidatus Cloacimonadota bacterium]